MSAHTHDYHKPINLIAGYRLKQKEDHAPKGKYKTFLSANGLSSTQLLMMYSLHVLKNKAEPSYGKEILDEVRSMISSEAWKLSHGTMYPVLHKMELNGLIRQVDTELKFKNRKFYEITEQGQQFYEENFQDFKRNIASSKSFFNRMMNKLN